MYNSRLLLVLVSIFASVSCGDYGKIQQACSYLEAELPGCVYYPGSVAFEQSVASYAYAESRLRPSCILGPKRVQDVTKAVQILTKFPSVEFAIRSGGHNTNKGFANTDRGITIDLAALNNVEVNSEKGSVSIEVGARWEKVYAAIERHGLSVQGGRVSSVGTGGYITGGGISFYSPEKGWACDSVKSFDIVLANGSLINAIAQSNPDLFKALKGGSNNFGIVTRFDLDTFEQGPLTGGAINYGNVKGGQVFDAVTSFKQARNFDKYAMLLVFISYETYKNSFSYSASFYHARPEKYFGSTLEAFTKITPQTNVILPVQDNTAGFFANQSVFDPGGSSETSETYMHWTSVHFRVTDTILHKINGLFREHATRLAEVPEYRSANLTAALILQSVPTIKPGNILGFDPRSHPEKDQLNLQIMYSFTQGRVEAALQRDINRLTKEVENIARKERALSRFVYLNYAGSGQKVLEGYGKKSVEELKRVAAKYDPYGVFQKQVTGGFKLSDVHL